MYLIDTNIIIWVLRGNKYYEDLLQRLKDEAPLSISTVTIAEIYKNVYPSETERTESVLKELAAWEVTSSIARQAGLYWQQYFSKQNGLHILDCIIAATAREHDLTVLTLNAKHFPMKDVAILDPKP